MIVLVASLALAAPQGAIGVEHGLATPRTAGLGLDAYGPDMLHPHVVGRADAWTRLTPVRIERGGWHGDLGARTAWMDDIGGWRMFRGTTWLAVEAVVGGRR